MILVGPLRLEILRFYGGLPAISEKNKIGLGFEAFFLSLSLLLPYVDYGKCRGRQMNNSEQCIG